MLRKRGAQAFSVDYKYSDLKDLRKSVNRYLASSGDKVYVKKSRETQNRFFGHIQNRRNTSYAAALAGALPFPDNSFDLCFSLQCMSKFLVEDPNVFMGAVKEALRVLKPGGQLKMQPWFRADQYLREREYKSAMKLYN